MLITLHPHINKKLFQIPARGVIMYSLFYCDEGKEGGWRLIDAYRVRRVGFEEGFGRTHLVIIKLNDLSCNSGIN